MSRAELLVLRAGDERVLREWTRASSIPAGLAQRARILLLVAQGHSNTEIGRLVGVSLPTVRLWRGRYRAGGPDLAALGVAAVEGRDLQVQHRPRARGQDPRRRGPVPGPARESGRGLHRREDPDPGARPNRPDPADPPP